MIQHEVLIERGGQMSIWVFDETNNDNSKRLIYSQEPRVRIHRISQSSDLFVRFMVAIGNNQPISSGRAEDDIWELEHQGFPFEIARAIINAMWSGPTIRFLCELTKDMKINNGYVKGVRLLENQLQ